MFFSPLSHFIAFCFSRLFDYRTCTNESSGLPLRFFAFVKPCVRMRLPSYRFCSFTNSSFFFLFHPFDSTLSLYQCHTCGGEVLIFSFLLRVVPVPPAVLFFFCFLPPFFLFLYCLHSFRTFTLIFFFLLSVTDRRKVNFLLHSSFCFPPYLCVA